MDRTAQTPTPFVGRQRELDLLEQAWEVEAGRPRWLVWTADTGVGKTRLLQAFFGWLSTDRDVAARLSTSAPVLSSGSIGTAWSDP